MVGARLAAPPGANQIVPAKLPGIPARLPPKVPARLPAPPPGAFSSAILRGAIGGTISVILTELLLPQSTAKTALDEIPPELLKPPGSGTVIQEEADATPTEWVGGTLPDTFYYLWYDVPILNATNDDVIGFSRRDTGFGSNTFSNLQLLATGIPVPLYHWNYEGTGIPPAINNRSRLYTLQHVRNGTTQQNTGLGTHVGVKILGFSPSNQSFTPIPGDQAFNDDGQPPIISTPEPITRPVPFDTPPGESNSKPLIKTPDKVLSPLKDSIEDVEKQIDSDQLKNEDRLLEDKNDILDQTTGGSGALAPSPPIIPGLPDIIPPEEIPEEIPELEEVTKIKSPDDLAEFIPLPVPGAPPQTPERFTPKVAPLLGGSALEPLLKKIELCCAEQQEADCCDEILAKLDTIKTIVDNIENITEEIDWQVNPPLPGSGDLATGTIPSNNGGAWTSLGNLVWVQLSMTVQPTVRYRVEYGNNNAPNVFFTGWFSWILAGGSIHRIPIDYSNAIFPAPKGATGFSFTCTNNAQFLANYWYDNRG